MAVSYTHLDVYKRQIDYIANHRTFESGVIAGCLTEEYNFNK